MKKFDFYQDEKVTAWRRTDFTITAETEEEARRIAKELCGRDVYLVSNEEAEKLGLEVGITRTDLDTIESITPEENQGNATMEVFSYSGEEIADNTPL